jgi:hypothetical protein
MSLIDDYPYELLSYQLNDWISKKKTVLPRTEQECHDGDPAPPDYREADLDLVAWMADDASELGNAAS